MLGCGEIPRAPSGLWHAVQPLAADEAAWRLRKCDISKAIAMTSQSAPGPDGVPYSAWRRLGDLAVDVLFSAAATLSTATGQERLLAAFPLDCDHNTPFNEAVMVFIPKKVEKVVGGVSCCEPGDVRPLSLVNTDNRLMANAVRLRVEPILAQAISPKQRGFLPGRSMLQNIVEIDGGMRAASLQHEQAAAVFFDLLPPTITCPRLLAGCLGTPLIAAIPSAVCRVPLLWQWVQDLCRRSAPSWLRH